MARLQQMIRVSTPACVIPGFMDRGWSLDFWIGDIAECEANVAKSEAVIREIVDLLPGACAFDLTSETGEEGDPVMEGFLVWNEWTYELVVNTFDGLVAINHPVREPLDQLLSVVGGSVQLGDN